MQLGLPRPLVAPWRRYFNLTHPLVHSTLHLLGVAPQTIGNDSAPPAFAVELFRSFLVKENALIFTPEILDIHRT